MTARQTQRLYCFDTSAFVTLSRTDENVIKIPTTLWDHLANMMRSGEIVSHKLVFDEISSNSKNPDFITQWITDKKEYFLPRSKAQEELMPEVVRKFPDLIDYAREREQADPWLIALAMEKSREQTLFDVKSAIVVSQENPNSSKKIPAACKHFKVEHLSLRNFFDALGLSTTLTKK